MNMKRLLLPFAAIAAFAMAYAQSENVPPKLSVKIPGSAKAGATVKATLTITFADGLHGYQNPPSDPDLIPIVVTVPTKGIKLKSVSYPMGTDESVGGDPKKVRVYEGTITVPIVFTAPKKKGKTSISVDLSYQQCNSETCFPPTDVKVSAPLTVK